MADPEENTPEYWNKLSLDIFEELKPEMDWMLDTLTMGGIAPGELLPTMETLKRMPPLQALTEIQQTITKPQTAAHGVSMLSSYLKWFEEQQLKNAPPASAITV